MKKLLALVLALVMSLSLVTISNAAYDDADQISNDEAVAVMSAVGVLEGSGNKFAPKDNLTREQAAKVVAYLALGKDVAEALPAVKVFDDVEVDRWSAKFIAYCAQEGIINGVGDNKFDPTSKVTGYAFAKMLFCALGYDAKNEGFIGNGWEVKVAQMMKKNDGALDLTDGVSAAASLALTREQAAQYMLNAIQLQIVNGYDGKGSNITIGDITISSDPGDVDLGNVYYKENYKKLVSVEDEDAFGRETREWKYDGEKVWKGVVATAELSYTGEVKSSDIYKDLGLNADVTASVVKNGKDDSNFAIAKKGADGKNVIGNVGAVVEVYKDGDDYTILVIDYDVAEVTDVQDAKYDKDGSVKEGKERKIEVTLKDSTTKLYETEKFAEDDIVLVAMAESKVEDVVLADSVTGKVSSMNKDGDAVINGTAYALDDVTVKAGDKGVFYLGVDGAIVKADAEKTSSDKFAFVYKLVESKDEVNEDGLTPDKYTTVYFVDADGVKSSAVLADGEKVTEKTAYAYTINSDDEFEVADESDVTFLTAAKKVAINKDIKSKKVAGKYMTGDTEFVFVDVGSKKVSTSVATGYKNVNIKDTVESYIGYDEDNYAVIVFVYGKSVAVEEDGASFLLDVAFSTSLNDDDETVYTYDVMIDGEETTLDTLKKIPADLKAGDKFTYEVDADGYAEQIAKVEPAKDGVKVASFVEDVIYTADEEIKLEDDTVIYKLADEDGYELGGTDNGDVANFTEVTKVAKDDVVRVYTDANGDVTFVVIVVKD